MATLNEQATWEDIYQIETTDLVVGGADGTSNIQARQLANRTAWLLTQLNDVYIRLDAAVNESEQQAMWGALEAVISDIGLLARELERLSCVKHQEGSFTLFNRGLINGCHLIINDTETRTVMITEGKCFLHGRTWSVSASSAQVPDNSYAWPSLVRVYLIPGDGGIQLAVGALNAPVPDDGVLLAEISLPADSTADSDPYLQTVVIARLARVEPDWPAVQISPEHNQVQLVNNMSNSSYSLAIDVVDYVGGERPTIISRSSDRATNTFRVYLAGAADNVTVRFVAHLMAQ